jgi:hypothetical protein
MPPRRYRVVASKRREQFLKCLEGKLEGRTYKNPKQVKKALAKANEDCATK